MISIKTSRALSYTPLSHCGMEELAYTVQKPHGGVAFARKSDGEQKEQARQMVLDLFAPNAWPCSLHMLTTPGVMWRFERKLLSAREPGWLRMTRPKRTFFTAFESDRALYYAGVAQMPGLHTPGSALKRVKATTASTVGEMGVKTNYASFFFGNVDDWMRVADWYGGWDAMWLDYTGPLTVERLAIIKRCYQKYINHAIIITALKARYNRATGEAIEKAGSYSKWILNHIDGDILHDIEYFDTSPMVQIAVRKPSVYYNGVAQ